MTEVDWRVTGNPDVLLGGVYHRADDRRLRLLASGCVRRAGHLLADNRSRRAVEVAEGDADSGPRPATRAADAEILWAAQEVVGAAAGAPAAVQRADGGRRGGG